MESPSSVEGATSVIMPDWIPTSASNSPQLHCEMMTFGTYQLTRLLRSGIVLPADHQLALGRQLAQGGRQHAAGVRRVDDQVDEAPLRRRPGVEEGLLVVE